MYSPIYQLTPALLTNLTTIERLYGQIEGLKIPHELELNLTRHNLVKSAYASNKIEGNPLSEREVTNLLLDDRVPVNRDEKEIVNYFTILEKLDNFLTVPLSLDLIIKLHRDLMTGVDNAAGEIRNVPVVVGKYTKESGDVSLRVKHNPPAHDRVGIEKLLSELITWIPNTTQMPPVLLSGLFHHQFVYIHPFEDGNGRLARILTALVFIKNHYQINKYFILDDYYDIDRSQYSDMLHSADQGDKTAWLEYFTDGVKYSLQSSLARVKIGLSQLKIQKRPTNSEAKVVTILQEFPEVTAPQVAEKLEVTRQQAHALLKSLVDKGIADKKGSTKSSYYKLK